MEEILNNGWVVGIGGGILSGLIVAWLTSTLFSKKDQKELAINISAANRELLYALRPEISENTIPSVSVIGALKNATARKYKVDPERLYTTTQISEELIKEIMDSSFISSSTKKSYCESLKQLAPKEEPISLNEIDNQVFVARIEYKEKMTMLLSSTLGVIAALATMFSLVKSTFESNTLFNKLLGSILPVILVMGSVLLIMTTTQVALKLRHKRIRAEHGIKDGENTNQSA